MEILNSIVSSERSIRIYPISDSKIYSIYRNQFFGEKCRFSFLQFFFEILPKFSDFVHFDGCIGKIRPQPVFIQKIFEVDEKTDFFSSEKMRNSCYFIYNYADSFFGYDF